MRFRQYLPVVAIAALAIAASSPAILDGTTSPATQSISKSTPVVTTLPHATESPALAQALVQRVQVMNAELERQAEEERQAAAAREEARRVSSASSPPATGTCAEMAPPGFSSSIITRESGGDPTQVNPDSGASGCAQILPSHFAPGGYCEGNGYQECWRRLKEGADRGDFPDPWACTRASGCS